MNSYANLKPKKNIKKENRKTVSRNYYVPAQTGIKNDTSFHDEKQSSYFPEDIRVHHNLNNRNQSSGNASFPMPSPEIIQRKVIVANHTLNNPEDVFANCKNLKEYGETNYCIYLDDESYIAYIKEMIEEKTIHKSPSYQT